MVKFQARWTCALALVALSGLWSLFSALGWLDGAEQWALNVRYHLRGPIESSVKVVYVNRDVTASNEFGRGWFPRDYYALAGEALLDIGRAKALFFDFVLTSDHLPKAEAPALNYSGNLKMQRFLMRYPNRVVLAAAYDGTWYPFSGYRSFLPDMIDGAWQGFDGGWKGYDPTMNPLPALPEYPMWFPFIEEAEFPGFPIGEVGLIDISESLNQNNYVQWVPALVRIANEQPALFLANSMARWQNTVVELTGRGSAVRAISEESVFRLVDQEGRRWNQLQRFMDLTFYSSALRLAQIGLEGSGWTVGEDRLQLHAEDGSVLRAIPLRAGQHVSVNWFSGWRTSDSINSETESLLEDREIEGWTFLGLARDVEGWCLEVEGGVSEATEVFRIWGYPNDRYNPSVSIAEVIILYDAYLFALEKNYSKVTALIEELFHQFADAYVLIGPTDPLLQDMGPTPFDFQNTPRVAVHGNLLKTVLDERYLYFLPGSIQPVVVFGLTLAVLLSLLGLSSRRRWHWFIAPCIVLLYVVIGCVLFSLGDVVLPMSAPVGSGMGVAMFGVGWRLWQEESQKIRLRRLFGTYVSPDVVELMVESAEEPKLGGNEREITAFFSDIASFTSISESLSAAQVVDLINEYVEAMTSILVVERGTLDKYIGDAIVGIFNAPHDLPDHACRACRTALAFVEAQRRLCRKWETDDLEWPELVRKMRTRIGLHTGVAVVGNMGSSQRFSYTMMGDSVNLASRLEQMGKVYGVDIVVSDMVRRAALEDEPEFVFRILDVTKVKGREAVICIYELMGIRSHISDQEERCIRLFEEGYAAFEARDLVKANARFASSSRLERRPSEMNPSRLYLARCKHMMDTLI